MAYMDDSINDVIFLNSMFDKSILTRHEKIFLAKINHTPRVGWFKSSKISMKPVYKSPMGGWMYTAVMLKRWRRRCIHDLETMPGKIYTKGFQKSFDYASTHTHTYTMRHYNLTVRLTLTTCVTCSSPITMRYFKFTVRILIGISSNRIVNYSLTLRREITLNMRAIFFFFFFYHGVI